MVLALLLIPVLACQKTPVVVHPGTFNQFDSNAYTALLDAQKTLNEAQVNIASGKWPAAWNQYVNQAGAAYNIALPAYNTYHNTLAGLQAGDVNQLQVQLKTDLDQLTSAIQALLKASGGAK